AAERDLARQQGTLASLAQGGETDLSRITLERVVGRCGHLSSPVRSRGRSDQNRHRSRLKPINEPRDQIRSASRDGGNDADLVVLGHRSGQVVEVANVLVVTVDIDEAAQFLAVEEPLAEGGKCGSQVRENLAHGRARRLDPILAPGVGAQGSGYSYRCHGVI